MGEFGETVTEEIEQIRLFLVHQIARKKYSCKHCQTKVLAAAQDGGANAGSKHRVVQAASACRLLSIAVICPTKRLEAGQGGAPAHH